MGAHTGLVVHIQVVFQGKGTNTDGRAAYTGAVGEGQAQSKLAERYLPVRVDLMDHIAVLDFQIPLPGAQLDLGHVQDLVLQVLTGQLDGVACAVGGTAGHSLPLVGGMIGVAKPAGDQIGVHIQGLCGDLDQRGLRALADLLSAGHKDIGAVLIHADNGGAAGVGGLGGRLPSCCNALAAFDGGRNVHGGLVVLNVLDHLLQTVMEAGDLHYLAGAGDAAHPQAVDAADVHGIHADGLGHLVDVLLDGKVDLAHTEAAVGAAHGMVGIDAVAVGPHIGDVVGSGRGPAAGLGDVDAILGVGAAVPHELGLDGHDLAILVDARLDLGVETLAHIGVLKLVLSAVAQLHRTARIALGQGDDDTFQGGARLGAEAAAHVGGDDPQFVQRDVKGGGQSLTHRIGRLDGAPDSDLAVQLVLGHGAVGFQRNVLYMGDVVGVFGDYIALGEGGVHVALAQFIVVGDVGMGLWMEDGGHLVGVQVRVDQRSVGLHALQSVEHRGQFLILHFDERDGLVSNLRGLSGHGGHCLAPILGGTDGQEVLILQIEAAALGVLIAGDDAAHAGQGLGLGDVDFQDFCMGIRGALDLGIEHSGHDDVIHIGGLTGHFFDGIYPLVRDAHRLHVCPPPFLAASSMASMIRAYPVQRHRLPLMASTISSREGEGFSCRRAVADMMKPGVQKPHWSAARSTKACCTLVSCPSFASPSTVVMCMPSSSGASTRQALIGLPSTITVQAPHSPAPQPSLVPVRASSSRRTRSMVLLAST